MSDVRSDRESGDAPEAGMHDEDEPTLEERIRRLEEILGSLENDEHTLDEALALFEEGISHVRTSEALLDRAVLRVEELLDDEGGTRPLDGPGESS
ncbi:MAG: exodeoxyribonuclease VII small subunit [Longimicrobiales bacterium]|nr:exodeoxyribonuclease VII small subunit [Longimicrobiales bacterium]